MKKNNHYIFGNNFYSYGVEFWGILFKYALADKVNVQINRFGTYLVRRNFGLDSMPLTPAIMADDISKPIYYRSFFTRTTIRHFNYYMEEYFGVSNAYKKLKAYLQIC